MLENPPKSQGDCSKCSEFEKAKNWPKQAYNASKWTKILVNHSADALSYADMVIQFIWNCLSMIITNPYEIHVSLIWYCGHTSPQKWLIFQEYAKIKLPHTAYYCFNRFETAHTHRKQPLLHLQNENWIEKTFGFFSTCWRTILITFHDVRSQCYCFERGLI